MRLNKHQKAAVEKVKSGEHATICEALGGVLEGPTLQAWKVSEICEQAGWHGDNLEASVATFLSESNGSVGAYNDNLDASGNVTSRDCGIPQINIPASQIGSDYETKLRTDPVFAIKEARKKWLAWGGDKGTQAGFKQGWNHWVGYSSGVAMDPAAAGYYIWRALRGIANHRGDVRGLGNPATVPAFYYQGGKRRPPGH